MQYVWSFCTLIQNKHVEAKRKMPTSRSCLMKNVSFTTTSILGTIYNLVNC